MKNRTQKRNDLNTQFLFFYSTIFLSPLMRKFFLNTTKNSSGLTMMRRNKKIIKFFISVVF